MILLLSYLFVPYTCNLVLPQLVHYANSVSLISTLFLSHRRPTVHHETQYMLTVLFFFTNFVDFYKIK